MKISLYGEQLIESLTIHHSIDNEYAEIPTSFEFNSNWKVEHSCLSCGIPVVIGQNFDLGKSNFSRVKNINTFGYTREFLQEIAALFDTVELVTIDKVFYLNRTDFEYHFDFQRTSSTDVTHYTCDSCHADYLALILVGSPEMPEKGMVQGRVGRVEFVDSVMIETSNGFMEYRNDHLVTGDVDDHSSN